jgi:hypothetical protein
MTMFKSIKKFFGKCLAVAGAVGTAVAVVAGNAHATAPSSLANALTVSIDNTVIWAAMAAILAIVAGIVAFKYVKHMFGGR